jgi:hypothetical protein
VFLDHIDPICFLALVTHLHTLIGLPIPYIYVGLGLWLVDLLSFAVMSVVRGFPSYMMLCLACVFVRVLVSHPSRCDLTVVRIDVVICARLEWWKQLDSIR